jgi:hypothetical protein
MMKEEQAHGPSQMPEKILDHETGTHILTRRRMSGTPHQMIQEHMLNRTYHPISYDNHTPL